MTEREREFADAARVVSESVVLRSMVQVTDFVGRSVADFVGRAFVERPFQGRGLAGDTNATLKGSLYVLGAGAACLIHALLLQWMPDRIAPAKPLAYVMVVAFGAFAAVSGFITMRSSATATADSSAGTAKTRKS
jgi:hypothetical protein